MFLVTVYYLGRPWHTEYFLGFLKSVSVTPLSLAGLCRARAPAPGYCEVLLTRGWASRR